MGDDTFVEDEIPVRAPRTVRRGRAARHSAMGNIPIPQRSYRNGSNMAGPAQFTSPILEFLGKLRRKEGATRRGVSLQIDVPLMLIISTLTVLGMVILYSSSWKYSIAESGSPTTIFFRQLTWTGLGLVAAIFMTFFDYHWLTKLALPIMGVTILGLLLVIFVHEERHGAVRTLLSGSIQPSELGKAAIVIYLSAWLFSHRDELHDIYLGLLPLGAILGIVAGFIALQPDISAVITIFVLGGMMFFLAGGELKQIIIVLLLGTMIGALFLASGVSATGTDRITTFLAGLKNPLDYSPHVQRSIEAFLKGGFFGVGIGNAEYKLTVLPFPHTDSVFAVVGEEMGILGATFLVALYAMIMWRALVIARNAPDGLGRLLAAGLGLWITLEAMINMAVMVGLMPFAGNALPLVSAGGSNRVVTLASIGILMSITRQSQQTIVEKERSANAVVDLRRRDWRRSEPRSRRRTKPASED